MIILFESNETSFTSMGLGAITDALTCTVVEASDGEYELQMEYPVSGQMYSNLIHDRIIFAKSRPTRAGETELATYQPFRIYDISDGTGSSITISAHHISYDATDVCVSPFSADTLDNAIGGIAGHTVNTNPLTISTVYHPAADEKKKLEMTVPSTLRALMLDELLKTYEYCVWKFDRFSAVLMSDGRDGSRPDDPKRGSDKGVVLRYGKNFTDMTQEENNTKVVTGIYPFWGSAKSSSQSVASLLLSGLSSFASGDMNLSKIVEKTGLDRETVQGYIEEYMSSDPHTVDLSALGGQTTGGDATQVATDTHTQTVAGTTTYNLGYDFIEVTKVTVNDKGTNNYEWSKEDGTITLATAPDVDATIKIEGSIPAILTLPEGIYAPEGYIPPAHSRVIPIDFSSDFSELPTVDDLRAKAAEYWKDNDLGNPEVSISLTYVDLRHILDYMNVDSYDDIELCDTVTVIFEKRGTTKKVQVNRVEYNVLAERITALDLGVPKRTLAKTLVEATKKETKAATTNQTVQATGETVTKTTTLYRRCISNVNPPAVPETETDKWMETKPEATTTRPYLWQKTLTEYSTGRADSSGFICIDDGAKTATSVEEQQTVYYLGADGTPDPPTGWVDSESVYSDEWSTVVPSPKVSQYGDQYCYYKLVQHKSVAGVVTNGPIEQFAASDTLLDILYISSDQEVKIQGSRLVAGSVAAASIAAKSLTVDQIAADGLQSKDYIPPEYGEHYAQRGLRLCLESGSTALIAENFAIDEDGNVWFNGDGIFNGTINATGGKIGVTQYDAINIEYDSTEQVTKLIFEQGEDGTGDWLMMEMSRLGILFGAGDSDGNSDKFTLKGESFMQGGVLSHKMKFKVENYFASISLDRENDGRLDGHWVLDDEGVYLSDEPTILLRDRLGGGGGGNVPDPTGSDNILISQYNSSTAEYHWVEQSKADFLDGVGLPTPTYDYGFLYSWNGSWYQAKLNQTDFLFEPLLARWSIRYPMPTPTVAGYVAVAVENSVTHTMQWVSRQLSYTELSNRPSIYTKTDFNANDFVENAQGKLSIVDKEYATQQWVNGRGYLTRNSFDTGTGGDFHEQESGMLVISDDKWALKSWVTSYLKANNNLGFYSDNAHLIVTKGSSLSRDLSLLLDDSGLLSNNALIATQTWVTNNAVNKTSTGAQTITRTGTGAGDSTPLVIKSANGTYSFLGFEKTGAASPQYFIGIDFSANKACYWTDNLHYYASEDFVTAYVTANPTASATAILSKIKIGDTIYGIQSSSGDVTLTDFNPAHFIADSGESYPVNLNLSTLSSIYASLGVKNTFTKPNMILGIDSDGDTSGQPALLKVIHNANSSTTQSVWQGRAIVGTKDLTFLLGTYHGLAGIGAHSWTDVTQGTGAAWANFYLNPDGGAKVFVGKQLGNLGWLADRGILAINNTNGKAYYADTSVNQDPTTKSEFEIATRGWVQRQDYCVTGDVDTMIEQALTNYYTKGTVDTMLTSYMPKSGGTFTDTVYFDSIYLKDSGGDYQDLVEWLYNIQDSIPSLVGYATQYWVTNTALDGYAKQSWVISQDYLDFDKLVDVFSVGPTGDFTMPDTSLNINPNKWALKSWVNGLLTDMATKTYVANRKITMVDGGVAIASNEDQELRIACGNQMIFRKTNENTITLEASLTCLIEGTKVLMADGTEKNVEDVRAGDIIESYDLNQNEHCQAVVVDAFCTGEEAVFNALVFEDETVIEFFGDHEIYNARTGDIKNVKIFAAGKDKALTVNGETPVLAFKTNVNHRVHKHHYVVVSSNCMYYAGGILMGHSPETLYQYGRNCDLPNTLHQSIEDLAVWGNDNRERMLAPDILPNVLNYMKRSYQARTSMESYGKSLDGTDYNDHKISEAFFKEFPKINNTGDLLKVIRSINLPTDRLEERQGWRDSIQVLEEEYASAESELSAYLEANGIEKGKYPIEKLYHANEVGNGLFGAYSEWAQSK